MLLLIPSLTVGTQLTLWTCFYTLKGAYLKTVKLEDKVSGV